MLRQVAVQAPYSSSSRAIRAIHCFKELARSCGRSRAEPVLHRSSMAASREDGSPRSDIRACDRIHREHVLPVAVLIGIHGVVDRIESLRRPGVGSRRDKQWAIVRPGILSGVAGEGGIGDNLKRISAVRTLDLSFGDLENSAPDAVSSAGTGIGPAVTSVGEDNRRSLGRQRGYRQEKGKCR